MNKIDFFKPLANGQSPTTDVFAWNWELFNDVTCRTIVNQGGTNSGKTYCICQCLLLWAFQNPNKIILITGEDLPQMRGDVITEFKKVLKSTILSLNHNIKKLGRNEYAYNETHQIVTLWNGTQIRFRAFGNEDDAKGKIDITYVFECKNVAYEIYQEASMRTDYKVILCYNPTARFWVHEHILSLSDTGTLISNFRNNTFLSENIKKVLLSYKDKESSLYNPHRWRTMGLGITGQVNGLCFPKCYQITPSEFPTDPKKTCYGLDWGFTNDPFVLCQLSLYDNRLCVRELVYETGLLNIDINQRLIELGLTKYDKIIADKSSPQNIADLRRYGWDVQPSKGKEITFGINKLNEQNLYMTSDSKNAWIEQQKYIINPKTNKPIDKFNHFWDAARYAHEGLFTDTAFPKSSQIYYT